MSASKLLQNLKVVVLKVLENLDVLVWRLVLMPLEVMEGMLGNVGNTHVGVPVDAALVSHEFAGENLDDCRLASTVGTDNGDA